MKAVVVLTGVTLDQLPQVGEFSAKVDDVQLLVPAEEFFEEILAVRPHVDEGIEVFGREHVLLGLGSEEDYVARLDFADLGTHEPVVSLRDHAFAVKLANYLSER